MLSRAVLAACAGGAAWLICMLVGILLVASGLPIATTVGAFITTYAIGIAILVAVAHFFGGLRL